MENMSQPSDSVSQIENFSGSMSIYSFCSQSEIDSMAPHGDMLVVVLVLFALAFGVCAQGDNVTGVTYDGRSLIINGKRELLFSGSIHYPRSTPEMWPDLLDKAKEGGLNLIQTYVFWNLHEPVEGQYNFEGNADLVKFIKLVGERKMFVTLRVGPFIQAEWNHGGLPYWLREKKDIIFRSYNEPFMHYMKKYASMIIDKMKENKLFASQGGPIVLGQIENEYNTVQISFRELGLKYIQWAANMAVALNTGVPWAMCKQVDAPDPVINACNGRHCGDTFPGPNKPYKPSIWTENWTAQYRVFGDPPSQRAAEDLAFSVARFCSKNGSLVNYYMYHGGTNFDRTSAVFTTTRYYDEAPLDEYGLQREPKWGHLRDVHKALNLCKKPLLWGIPGAFTQGPGLEARFYEKPGTNICAAFLTNNDTRTAITINFRGNAYLLPPRSISILPDCKTVVYNTQSIVSQHNARNFVSSKVASNLKWKMWPEQIPTVEHAPVINKMPLELYSLLKDTTDYAWYTTSIELDKKDVSKRPDILPVIRIACLGHGLHAFANGQYLGTAHGSHEEKTFVFQESLSLNPGTNHIAVLGWTVGLPDSGVYMEHRYAGPRFVTILGLNTGTLDISRNGWGHKVGLHGEKLEVFTEKGSRGVEWQDIKENKTPLTWYKTYFDAPEGNDPVAIRMNGTGKGYIWVNGNNVGRYWMSYLSPLKKPSQLEYHIPRAYIKPTENLLVIFEEEAVTPEEVEILLVNRDTICSFISEFHPPSVKTWDRKDKQFKAKVEELRPSAHLQCPNFKKIAAIEFASYGDPSGVCGEYEHGRCSQESEAKKLVEQYCLGKETCTVPFDAFNHLKIDCIKKKLAIQAKCSA